MYILKVEVELDKLKAETSKLYAKHLRLTIEHANLYAEAAKAHERLLHPGIVFAATGVAAVLTRLLAQTTAI